MPTICFCQYGVTYCLTEIYALMWISDWRGESSVCLVIICLSDCYIAVCTNCSETDSNLSPVLPRRQILRAAVISQWWCIRTDRWPGGWSVRQRDAWLGRSWVPPLDRHCLYLPSVSGWCRWLHLPAWRHMSQVPCAFRTIRRWTAGLICIAYIGHRNPRPDYLHHRRLRDHAQP